jgi:cation transport regulator ChaC
MHVFTYGSLMYRRVWEHVITCTYPSCSGVIHGYARRRIGGKTYPALVQAAPDTVEGVVYLHVSARDLAAL